MSDIDPFEILEKYNLKEKGDAEIRRNKKKLDEPPFNMQGRYKIYCDFLGEEWVKLRDQRDKLAENICTQSDGRCFINRLDKNKISQLCKDCSIAKEIEPLEAAMNELSAASKKLKEYADYDEANR